MDGVGRKLVTKTWMWEIFLQGPILSIGVDALRLCYAFLQAPANCAKMLGQKHFAEPNQHVLTFLHSILICSVTSEHQWSCSKMHGIYTKWNRLLRKTSQLKVRVKNLKVHTAKEASNGWAHCHTQCTCTDKCRRGTCELLNWNMVRNIAPIYCPCTP